MKVPRKNSLVRCVDDNVIRLYRYLEGDLLFLGQIPNMPGHCVVVDKHGRVSFGWHVENFVELTEEEV